MKRIGSEALAFILVLLTAWGYGSCQRKAGADEAKREAAIATDKAIADSSRAWLARLPAKLAPVAADTARARKAARAADRLHVKREALPPPPDTATASDSAAYWKEQAELAKAEAAHWKTAYEAQMQATARLSALLDTTTAQLEAVTAGLTRSIHRETHQGFRVPKLVTEIVGCTAGYLLAKPEDKALGCAAGAAGLTLVTPTR